MMNTTEENKIKRPKANMIKSNEDKPNSPVRCNLCGLLYANLSSYKDHIFWCIKDHPDMDPYMLRKEES